MTQPDSTQDLLALPRAAVLMLWTAAYLRGDVGPDDAAELSLGVGHHAVGGEGEDLFDWMTGLRRLPLAQLRLVLPRPGRIRRDRKSTRLNSSHVAISYAVFCLKKKKKRCT